MPDIAALLAGWLGVALASAVALALRAQSSLPLSTKLTGQLYQAGHLLALGLVTAGVAAAHRRFGPRRPALAWGALAALCFAAGYPLLAEDLSGLADRLTRVVHAHALWMVVLTFAVALLVPLALAAGNLLARPWLRLAGVAGGLALTALHADNYPQSYLGLHLWCALLAAVAIGASLRGSALVNLVTRIPRRAQIGLAAAMAVPAMASLVAWPSNAVVLHLTRNPGAALVPFLEQLRVREMGLARIPPSQKEWFADRKALPPIPPSNPRLLGPDAVVIMLGIDSLRADVLADEARRADFPELFRLRDESVHFTQARSAGSSTAPSLAAIFSGLYYSQLYWTKPATEDGAVYPHEDPSPRFPELLTAAGVKTVTFDGSGWLLNDNGIVRGFEEETTLREGIYTPGRKLLGLALKRLAEHGSERLFLFMHFLDAHFPYETAGRKATPFEGYLAELRLVDAQLRRLREALESANLLQRATFIVFADHGEAFGEHGMTWHGQTLYDELLRVPLLVRIPGVAPRVVREPVSLVDLGPTILDLMGIATPPRFMGQSLTGYLRGETPKLTRPIVAEARLKRALVMPDGFKVIQDSRSRSVEIYDLNTDPREENNLYREDAPSSNERLGALLGFFQAHTLRRPGYKVPYRKW